MNPMVRRTLLAGAAAVLAAALAVPGAVAVGTATGQYSESEAATVAGRNDAPWSAERLSGFGTDRWARPAATVHGTLSPAPVELTAGAEDNGAIPLSTATGIGTDDRRAITTTGRLGDGPHGVAGDGTNDFDFYKLTGTAGHTLTVSTDGSVADTDTVVGVYDANGTLLASDDDGGTGLQSKLAIELPATGEYYVVVAGASQAGSLPADPATSGSGLGGADEGNYSLLIAAAPVDQDYYAVQLRKGDVLGAAVTGAAKQLTVYRPNGAEAVGSARNLAAKYPAASPLPRTGNAALAYVADGTGWYYVKVSDGFGAYDLSLTADRPGTETAAQAQMIFLDFDGGQIDTAALGGPGVRQLSGLSAFLTRWGLQSTDESAVISKAVAVVNENIKSDLVRKGTNPDVAVTIRNSRDDADRFGTAGVSRVVVGGTAAESGINRLGVAQSVDPGNFAQEETALVQLDRLSAATGSQTINRYLTADSNRVAFVGQVLGNLISREVGHLVGNYDTDAAGAVANLMDADGNAPVLYGVGQDGVGGTSDDVDVDLGKDTYAATQGFTGTQDTLNVAAWGLSKPCN